MDKGMTKEESDLEMVYQIYNDFIRALGCVIFLEKPERNKLNRWLEGCKTSDLWETEVLKAMQNFVDYSD
jgi:hypothetical protein